MSESNVAYMPQRNAETLRPVAADLLQTTRLSNGVKLAKLRIQGRNWETKVVPQCYVCSVVDMDVYRRIHILAAEMTTVPAIHAVCKDAVHTHGKGLSKRNIRDHLVHHFGQWGETIELAEQVAIMLYGAENAERFRLDSRMSAQMLLQRATAAMLNNEMDYKPSDIMSAARFLHEVEMMEEGDEDRVLVMQNAMLLMMDRIRTTIDPGSYKRLMHGIYADRELERVMRYLNGQLDAIEAQAFENEGRESEPGPEPVAAIAPAPVDTSKIV